jgi:hypothetical protein
LSGCIAALALTGFVGLGLPDPWPKVLGLLAAACLAALGYHATDCSTCPGKALRSSAALLAITLCVVAAGCAVGKLAVGVSSPAFGSVKISVGEGVIGHPGTNTLTGLDLTNGVH